MPWGRLPALHHKPEGAYTLKPESPSLGDGGSFNAGVYVVKRRQDGRKCVEKRFKPTDILNGTAKFEITLLRELKYTHITEYIDSFIEKSGNTPQASIYMEYCDLGTLADLLNQRRRENKPAKESSVWELFIQLTNAVVYLQYGIHDAVFEPMGANDSPWSWIGIVHRDIKPANIFLRTNYRSNLPHLVLGDFGQAIRLDDHGNWDRPHMGGIFDWAPPEAPRFGFCSDTWSIGNVVQAICRLETSPPSIGPKRTFWGAGEGYSKNLDVAIHTLMRSNHRDRPSLAKFAPDLDKMRHQVPDGKGVNSYEANNAAYNPLAV